MKMTKLVRTVAVLYLVGMGAGARAATINFDDLTPGTFAGDSLASQGVVFNSATVDLENISVGDDITLTFVTNAFNVSSPSARGAVSLPNYAIGVTVARSDMLFSFTTPVTSASLATDVELNETPQLVRLLALEETSTANVFTVLALDEGSSNAVSAPGNILSVDLGGTPFDVALFQITGSGAEGFDDLTFSPVPLPAALWLFSSGLCALWLVARRRRVAA